MPECKVTEAQEIDAKGQSAQNFVLDRFLGIFHPGLPQIRVFEETLLMVYPGRGYLYIMLLSQE